MSTSLEELQQFLVAREDEHLELKEAKDRYDFELLVKYCAALANEGGGRMILGVTDAPSMKATQVQNLLRELKRDGQAHSVGRTKAARWFPGPAPEHDRG